MLSYSAILAGPTSACQAARASVQKFRVHGLAGVSCGQCAGLLAAPDCVGEEVLVGVAGGAVTGPKESSWTPYLP